MNRFAAATAAIVLTGATALAEGYQVNTLSARQNGMGHTGTALHLGAESMIFNPAGLGFMDQTLEFSGSGTAILATAKATLPDGKEYTTDNTPSTPMAFNLGMNVYDNFKAGVSFYTPYGSGINWGMNWPGAVLNQKVSLKAFTVQPTLAWRPIDGLSVGVGAMLTWGTVNLDKGLVPNDSFNALLAQAGLPAMGDTPASINLNGKAAVTAGVNAGIMWDINKKWTVGFSFRQKMNLKVKCGTAMVNYANETAQALLQNSLNILNEANFTASMPAAAVYNFGVSYKPIKKLVLAFDAQLTGWKAYKSLDIEFLSEQLAPYNQFITKNYHNSWTFHLGGQYDLTERLELRAGLMVDTTPVNKEHYNPETPGMTKIEPSVGFSFSPVKNFSIDAALLYVAGTGAKNASCTYDDLLLKTMGLPYERTFTADYKVHAWNPSLGVTFKF
ncbi:MAG: outer membrane protein transport protein [Muribaculaceae bacterium]|nr:outer membrane protein transport protein [Muribaculaceae bacterium]